MAGYPDAGYRNTRQFILTKIVFLYTYAISGHLISCPSLKTVQAEVHLEPILHHAKTILGQNISCTDCSIYIIKVNLIGQCPLLQRRDVTLSAGGCSWTLSTVLAVGLAFLTAALVK